MDREALEGVVRRALAGSDRDLERDVEAVLDALAAEGALVPPAPPSPRYVTWLRDVLDGHIGIYGDPARPDRSDVPTEFIDWAIAERLIVRQMGQGRIVWPPTPAARHVHRAWTTQT